MRRALILGVMALSMAALMVLSGDDERAEAGGICTIQVTSALDNFTVDDDVTLREAIGFATDLYTPILAETNYVSGCPAPFEDNPGAFTQDAIVFSIPGPASDAPITINLTMGDLPPLNKGNDRVSALGDNITVDGGGTDTCFTLSGVSNSIEFLKVRNCGIGVLVAGIETVPLGLPQPQGPIVLDATGNLVIGNVIGGNDTGVLLDQGAVDTIVAANFIGTDETGSVADGNDVGVVVLSEDPNRIGGPSGIPSGVTQPAGNLTVLGNIISGNLENGVHIFGDLTEVEGNHIGLNYAGTAANPNGGSGVIVQNGENNDIDSNVISGNGGPGVEICCDMADGNGVFLNLIGTNASGDAAIGNGDHGARIAAPRTDLGGAGVGNVISGNDFGGVLMVGENAVDTWVQGNRIGVAAESDDPIPNNGYGIAAVGSGPNLIGGPNFDSEGNVVAYNTGGGIGVTMVGGASTGKRILRNSIFANGGLGVDLEQDGVTLNDNLDPDTGGNARQNYPVLSSATANGGLTVEGTLNSTANTGFEIQFFANSACDPSGLGEGEDYVGSEFVTTDAGGNVGFNADFPPFAGQFMTATATSAEGNTSEFSACAEIESLATLTPTPSPTPGPTPTASPTGAPAGILGDTDCDEDVDAVDGLHVLQDAAGFDPDADCLAQGDVQCDGDRDAVDALGILTFVAALPPQPQEPGCVGIGEPIA